MYVADDKNMTIAVCLMCIW